MIIAVDGPAAAGKGTLARQLARHFGFAYLDTGSLYRAVALAVLHAGGAPDDPVAGVAAAQALDVAAIDQVAIRSPEIGQAASQVAALLPVRQAILDFQRDFAAHPPGNAQGAVLDGRDIGTVVCPKADIKFYVTASPEIRAHRRFLELQAAGNSVSEADVLAEVKGRDARDAERAHSPLKPAADAHLLDTSNLSIETAFDAALSVIDQAKS